MKFDKIIGLLELVLKKYITHPNPQNGRKIPDFQLWFQFLKTAWQKAYSLPDIYDGNVWLNNQPLTTFRKKFYLRCLTWFYECTSIWFNSKIFLNFFDIWISNLDIRIITKKKKSKSEKNPWRRIHLDSCVIQELYQIKIFDENL